jgi:hypothetical protein
VIEGVELFRQASETMCHEEQRQGTGVPRLPEQHAQRPFGCTHVVRSWGRCSSCIDPRALATSHHHSRGCLIRTEGPATGSEEQTEVQDGTLHVDMGHATA